MLEVFLLFSYHILINIVCEYGNRMKTRQMLLWNIIIPVINFNNKCRNHSLARNRTLKMFTNFMTFISC